MRENVLKLGIQKLEDKYGTEYYFSPKNHRNAEILIEIYNDLERYKFPEGYHNIIQAILLGYHETSIVLENLEEQLMNYAYAASGEEVEAWLIGPGAKEIELLYRQNLPIFAQRIGEIIIIAKRWINFIYLIDK